MAERLILMNQQMVKATLDNLKSQTRRVLKTKNVDNIDLSGAVPEIRNKYHFLRLKNGNEFGGPVKCPYGKVGDLLWVRETFGVTWQDGALFDPVINYRANGRQSPIIDTEIKRYWQSRYLDTTKTKWNPNKWYPSIYMPKLYTRLWLKIKEIRVERVQDITDLGSLREGSVSFENTELVRPGYYKKVKAALEKNEKPPLGPGPKERFRWLWDEINANRKDKAGNILLYSWDDNPYVWVVVFERFNK
jgi:hypothetical protein